MLFRKLLPFFLIFLSCFSWCKESLAQSTKSFRFSKRIDIYQSVDEKGARRFFVFPNVRDQCAVDRLFAEDVRNYLKLSERQVRKVEESRPIYIRSMIDLIRTQKNETAGLDQAQIEAAETVMEILNGGQRTKLEKLDRYLVLRKMGASTWLKTFINDVPETTLLTVARDEKQLWNAAFESGKSNWGSCLEKILQVLKDYPQIADEFETQMEDFKGAAYADYSLTTFAQPIKEQKDYADKYKQVEDLLCSDTQAMLETSGQFGNVKIHHPKTIGTNLRFVINRTWDNPFYRTSSEIEMTEGQQGEYAQLEHAYLKERNAHEETRPKTDQDPVTSAIWQNQLGLIDQNYAKKLWNEFLFPHQQDALIKIIQRINSVSEGPVNLLAKPELSDTDKKRISKEFETFQEKLEQSEKKLHSDLINLLQNNTSHALGFSLNDRPDYLRPSLILIQINAEQTFSKPMKIFGWDNE
jgi:hypothetical protein